MSMCLDFLMGSSVLDPDFRERFVANPGQLCCTFGGTTTEGAGLAALTRSDLHILNEQLESVQKALGDVAEPKDKTGARIIIGHAMLDVEFARKLQADPKGTLIELFGRKGVAQDMISFFQSAKFKRLGFFGDHREAMRSAGAHFASASSKSSLKRAVLEAAIQGIRSELQSGAIRL